MSDGSEPTPTGPDPAEAGTDADLHRRFAVQLNNGVYDGLGHLGPDSTAHDREQVLYAAYASTYHWMQIGNEANHARGEYLIAKAALGIGRSALALQHAKRCLELIDLHHDQVDDWDAPFAYEVLARSLAGTGDVEGAKAALAHCTRLTAMVADPEDRAVIEGSLAEEPWFGLR